MDNGEQPSKWQKLRTFLFGRAQAYKSTFDSEAGKDVLADLGRFCRAHESTFHSDSRASAVLQGRREVWLRIQHHLNLTNEELWALYGRQ